VAAARHRRAGAGGRGAGRSRRPRLCPDAVRRPSHEIEIPLGPDFRDRFDTEHARAYGHADAARAVEVLALRLEVTEAVLRQGRRRAVPRRRLRSAAKRHRLVWRGRLIDVAHWDRETLSPGVRLRGPALVVEYSSTTFVAPGWQGHVDAERHLHLVAERR
jgi:N-methylhydantoinase A/oxoprolinase/acetone carboxylase beta subunit